MDFLKKSALDVARRGFEGLALDFSLTFFAFGAIMTVEYRAFPETGDFCYKEGLRHEIAACQIA